MTNLAMLAFSRTDWANYLVLTVINNFDFCYIFSCSRGWTKVTQGSHILLSQEIPGQYNWQLPISQPNTHEVLSLAVLELTRPSCRPIRWFVGRRGFTRHDEGQLELHPLSGLIEHHLISLVGPCRPSIVLFQDEDAFLPIIM